MFLAVAVEVAVEDAFGARAEVTFERVGRTHILFENAGRGGGGDFFELRGGWDAPGVGLGEELVELVFGIA